MSIVTKGTIQVSMPKRPQARFADGLHKLIRKLHRSSHTERLKCTKALVPIIHGLFEREGLDFSGWRITEVPIADPTGQYIVVLTLRLTNDTLGKSISVDIGADANFIAAYPDATELVAMTSIRTAIDDALSSD